MHESTPISPSAHVLSDEHLEDASAWIIKPARRRLRLRDLRRQGAVIRVLAARDFKIKYKQSLFGPLWLIFQPLALLAAFVVAFNGLADVATSGVPYIPFALVGLMPWAFFQASMTIGAASVLTNAGFVRYTPCPRSAFPIAAIIASIPALGVTAVGAFAATAGTGYLSLRALLLPVGLLWLLILVAGVVGITSALAVRYRDIINALPFLLQVAVFFAPIGYSLAGLSSTVRSIVGINPLTGIIESLRWMMLDGYSPSVEPILVSLTLTPLIAWAGWRVFTRLETTMADDI